MLMKMQEIVRVESHESRENASNPRQANILQKINNLYQPCHYVDEKVGDIDRYKTPLLCALEPSTAAGQSTRLLPTPPAVTHYPVSVIGGFDSRDEGY